MFGFQRRGERRWECETCIPNPGVFPQMSQTAAMAKGMVAATPCDPGLRGGLGFPAETPRSKEHRPDGEHGDQCPERHDEGDTSARTGRRGGPGAEGGGGR